MFFKIYLEQIWLSLISELLSFTFTEACHIQHLILYVLVTFEPVIQTETWLF